MGIVHPARIPIVDHSSGVAHVRGRRRSAKKAEGCTKAIYTYLLQEFRDGCGVRKMCGCLHYYLRSDSGRGVHRMGFQLAEKAAWNFVIRKHTVQGCHTVWWRSCVQQVADAARLQKTRMVYSMVRWRFCFNRLDSIGGSRWGLIDGSMTVLYWRNVCEMFLNIKFLNMWRCDSFECGCIVLVCMKFCVGFLKTIALRNVNLFMCMNI